MAGREGLLSARATAGTESSVPVVVTNTGTAPAENVQLSGNAPSGWKVTFDPKTIERIAPNQHQEVQALITPAGQGDRRRLCGELQQPPRAARTAARISASPWRPRPMWGIAGVGIIGAALLIMVGAVARFGRR